MIQPTGNHKLDAILGVCGTLLAFGGAAATQASDLPVSAKWMAWSVGITAGATTIYNNTKRKRKNERAETTEDGL